MQTYEQFTEEREQIRKAHVEAGKCEKRVQVRFGYTRLCKRNARMILRYHDTDIEDKQFCKGHGEDELASALSSIISVVKEL